MLTDVTDIHETMLKDTVRTDAYRDFIYDNKHIFNDKIVLDVGCGTGILSMFCAKAGAKMVIAVDNSDVIDKARQIVFENGLGDVVKCVVCKTLNLALTDSFLRCLRGKIEEVALPVPKVDIIVSEWMGYCLLFEAMLDSVIWARDHYLSETGIMVPSHATLRLAPMNDRDFVDSHVTFWNSVYGFNMSCMLDGSYDQAMCKTVSPEAVAADSVSFLHLDLRTTSVAELQFSTAFSITLNKDIDSLDAWVIWFDIFFMPSRSSTMSDSASPSGMVKNGFVAFTTGPFGPETHWKHGILLVDRRKRNAVPLKKNAKLVGQIMFKKRSPKARHLEMRVKWCAEGGVEEGDQQWSIE